MWITGFGEDFENNTLNPNMPKPCTDICFNVFSDDETKDFIIDPKILLNAQISNISANEITVFDFLKNNTIVGSKLLELLTYERVFIKDLDLIINTVFPSIENGKFAKLENTLKISLSELRQYHINYLDLLEKVLAKPTEDKIKPFLLGVLKGKEILKSHNNYMNKFFLVETIANIFSCEESRKYTAETNNKPLIRILRSPVYWQEYISSSIREINKILPESIQKMYVQNFESYAHEIDLLSDSIDSLPKLESISQMFISEPFPIVVPGRRLLLRGSALKHCRSDITRREIFLFSDLFMYAQINVGILRKPADYPLSHLRVDLDKDFKIQGLSVYTPKKSFVLEFDTAKERDTWYNAMREAVENARSQLDAPEEYREAPIWIPDSAKTHCMVCGREFTTFTRRRHHCRVCGQLLCADCLPHKIIVPNISSTKPVKICDNCYSQHFAKK